MKNFADLTEREVLAVAISSVWAFVFTYGMLWIIDRLTPVKVSEGTETVGLDEGIHGERAYLEESI